MRTRIKSHPFEIATGILAVSAGVTGLITERAGVVAEAAPALAGIWLWGYVLAGVCILAGFVTGRVAVEACGLILFVGALVTQQVAAFFALDRDPSALAFAFVSTGPFVLAAIVRLWGIFGRERLLYVEGRSVVLEMGDRRRGDDPDNNQGRRRGDRAQGDG